MGGVTIGKSVWSVNGNGLPGALRSRLSPPMRRSRVRMFPLLWAGCTCGRGAGFGGKDNLVAGIDVVEVAADPHRALGNSLIDSGHQKISDDVLLRRTTARECPGSAAPPLPHDHQLVVLLQALERAQVDQSLVELANQEGGPRRENAGDLCRRASGTSHGPGRFPCGKPQSCR